MASSFDVIVEQMAEIRASLMRAENALYQAETLLQQDIDDDVVEDSTRNHAREGTTHLREAVVESMSAALALSIATGISVKREDPFAKFSDDDYGTVN